MLKRDVPYAGHNEFSVVAGVTTGDLRPPRPEDFVSFPPAFLITWAVAERCWLSDPLLRPSMSQVVRLLADAQPIVGAL